MSVSKLKMRKLNEHWRKITGKTTTGVKLSEKLSTVISYYGHVVPSNKALRLELARDIMSKPHFRSGAGSEIFKPSSNHSVVQERTSKKCSKKSANAFYASWEWKKVRYVALKMHGRRCQCCGWRPGDTEHGHLVVDHIKPRSKYPSLELELSNLQIACNDCNMGKSNIHLDDFREVDNWLSAICSEE